MNTSNEPYAVPSVEEAIDRWYNVFNTIKPLTLVEFKLSYGLCHLRTWYQSYDITMKYFSECYMLPKGYRNGYMIKSFDEKCMDIAFIANKVGYWTERFNKQLNMNMTTLEFAKQYNMVVKEWDINYDMSLEMQMEHLQHQT